MNRALALVVLAGACREHPAELGSCGDSLAGVWVDPADRRYHILDDGKTVSIFPMWDTSRLADGTKSVAPPSGAGDGLPIRSPVRIDVPRPELAGRGSFRLTRGDDTCLVTYPVALRECRGAAMIFVTPDVAALGSTCQPDVSPSNVRLRRE